MTLAVLSFVAWCGPAWATVRCGRAPLHSGPIEDISHLVGHANTRVTETVYRKELLPVLTLGPRLWMRFAHLTARTW